MGEDTKKKQNIYVYLKDYTSIDKENCKITDENNEKLENIDDGFYVEIIKALSEIGTRKDSNDNLLILADDREEESSNDIKLIKRFNASCWTQNYVGLLQYDNMKIFIGSRFDNNDEYNFLNYIMDKALDIRTLIFNDVHPQVAKERAMEKLLAVVFVQQINKAYKKGIFRKYRSFEENDAKVKGKIDISRHVKINPIFNGKIAYSHREYTIDNEINRLILTAFSMLEKQEPHFIKNLLNKYKNVKECMQQLGNIMLPASRQEVIGMLRKAYNKVTHSVYKDWEAVRKTAIMILRHMGIHTAKHGNNKIFGVFCNITKIWEEYLKSIFDNELGCKAQDNMSILEGKRTLKPDFYWEKKVVADAKYKSNWEKIAESQDKAWDEVREDVFQVLAYMYGFECKAGGIICPCKVTSEKQKIKLFNDDNRKQQFYVLPLCIPQESEYFGYDDFKNKIKDNEEKLAKAIQEMLSEN